MVAPRDWLLLAISSANGRAVSPVQLQKCLFLLSKKIPDQTGPSFYKFIPHNYGPFSSSIYHDAEIMEEEGLLVSTRPPGRNWVEYSATPIGMEQSSVIERELPAPVVQYVKDTMIWCRDQSFRDLVQSIYDGYPDYRENSVFQG